MTTASIPALLPRMQNLAAALGEHPRHVVAMALVAALVAVACAAALGAAPALAHGIGELNAGSARVLLAFVGLLLWLCLLGLAGAAWWSGAFDALRAHRGVQAVLVAGTVTALALAATHYAHAALEAAVAA